MKMMLYFSMYTLLAATVSCSKEKAPEPQESRYWGSSTAETSEGNWTTNSIGASQFLYPGFELTLYREVNSNILEEISLRRIPLRLGKHYITANSVVNDSLTGIMHAYREQLDMVYSVYIADPESADNFVELTKYDPATQVIEGRFSFSFIKDGKDASYATARPYRMDFRNGIFKTKFFETTRSH